MADDVIDQVLLPFVDAGKYGLRRVDGSPAVSAKFQYADRSREGIVEACGNDGELILIDAKTLAEKHCSDLQTSGGSFFSNGRIATTRQRDPGSLEGYADKNGKLVIPFRFSHARDFDKCGATVKVDASDKFVRRINFDGDIVGTEFLAIRPFHPLGKQCGATVRWSPPGMVLVDGQGLQISSEVYVEVWQEHEGLTPVKLSESLVGWLDTDGNLVDSVAARAIGNHFESGLVPLQDSSDKWGLINRRLEWVIEPQWDVIESVGENRFLAGSRDQKENTSVRLIDGCGNVFGQHSFKWIGRFQEGVAQVFRLPLADTEFEEVSEFNFIDMQGELLFEDWV